MTSELKIKPQFLLFSDLFTQTLSSRQFSPLLAFKIVVFTLFPVHPVSFSGVRRFSACARCVLRRGGGGCGDAAA